MRRPDMLTHAKLAYLRNLCKLHHTGKTIVMSVALSNHSRNRTYSGPGISKSEKIITYMISSRNFIFQTKREKVAKILSPKI